MTAFASTNGSGRLSAPCLSRIGSVQSNHCHLTPATAAKEARDASLSPLHAIPRVTVQKRASAAADLTKLSRKDYIIPGGRFECELTDLCQLSLKLDISSEPVVARTCKPVLCRPAHRFVKLQMLASLLGAPVKPAPRENPPLSNSKI